MGDRVAERLPRVTRIVLIIFLTTVVLSTAAGAVGAMTADSSATEQPVSNNLLTPEEEQGVDVGEDGIDVLDEDGNFNVTVLESQVYNATTEDETTFDVVFVPEMSFAMHHEWWTHYPGSGPVENLVDEGVLEADSVSDVEDEGLGLNMRGVHQYDCDEYDPWYYVFSSPDPWCGWHQDMDSPSGDTEVAHIDYRTLGIDDLAEIQTGQLTFDYQVYNDETDEWVDLPRGSGDTYFGVGQGYWEWTSDTDEYLLDVTGDQHESMYHIDLRVADLPNWIGPDANDWAFDMEEMGDDHVRITYDSPLLGFDEGFEFTGGADVLKQEPVDPFGDRFDAMFEITNALDSTGVGTNNVGMAVNGDTILELPDQDSTATLNDIGDDVQDLETIDEDIDPEDDDWFADAWDGEEGEWDFSQVDGGLEEMNEKLLEMMFDPELEYYGEFGVWNSLDEADQMLQEQGDESNENVVVLLSDGIEPQTEPDGFMSNLWDSVTFWEDDTGAVEQLDEHDERIESVLEEIDDETTVHTVGLGDSPDHWRLERIAEETGGQYVDVDSVEQLADTLGHDDDGSTIEYDVNHKTVTFASNNDVTTTQSALELAGDEFVETNANEGVTFELGVEDCDGSEEIDADDVPGADPEELVGFDVEFTHYECESGEETAEIGIDLNDDVFTYGDEVSDIDDRVPTDARMEAADRLPSDLIPSHFTDDGKLSLTDSALVTLPVTADETGGAEGYVLLHVEPGDADEGSFTHYNVDVHEDELADRNEDVWYDEGGYEGVIAGDDIEVPVEIENLGDVTDDDDESLTERVSVYLEDDGVQLLNETEIDATEVADTDGTFNLTITTEEGDGGLNGELVVASQSDVDRTDDEYDVVAPGLDLDVDVDVVDDGETIEEIDLTQAVADGESVDVTVDVTNYGPDEDEIEVGLAVSDSIETISEDIGNQSAENNNLEVTFQWSPGLSDLGIDPVEMTGTGAETIEIEAMAGDTTETVEITATYNFDEHEDLDPSITDHDETELDPVSVDVDEVEFDK